MRAARGFSACLASVKYMASDAVILLAFEARLPVPFARGSGMGGFAPLFHGCFLQASVKTGQVNSPGMSISVRNESRYLDTPHRKMCMMSTVESRTIS